jgi:hypothetical protein
LVLFLQRYAFALFLPCHFNKVGPCIVWPKLLLYALVPFFWVFFSYIDCNWTSLSHVTFAGYVRRDSCWFTICYILFEQIETEVRIKVSFWPASWSSFY